MEWEDELSPTKKEEKKEEQSIVRDNYDKSSENSEHSKDSVRKESDIDIRERETPIVADSWQPSKRPQTTHQPLEWSEPDVKPIEQEILRSEENAASIQKPWKEKSQNNVVSCYS
ncbi:MAG: hypothetical protein CMH61_02775 [Nanoarchaeota archaeon]|nr:hypothetical protein [Nanoarchaeota archaeon]|tara:strand:- start:6624 stop:6968 length:345 start_codon:yes stop_codon:yes gene_type:complete